MVSGFLSRVEIGEGQAFICADFDNVGRRSCPGETAARVAVFLYFVVMLQKYSIKLSSQHPAPSMKNTHGFSRSPLRYYVTIRRRL